MQRRLTTASLIGILALLLGGSTVPALAGGGCHGPDGSAYTEGAATVVRMDVCSFEPTVVRVPVGTTVRFLNTAPNDHAVAGRGQTWVSDDVLRPGAEFSERFDKAGIYPYACPLHVGMVGAVIVGEPVAAAGAGSEAPAAPVAAGDVAGTTSSATDTEATPVAPAAVAGLVGGGLLGLLGAFALGRRRSEATTSGRAQPSSTEG